MEFLLVASKDELGTRLKELYKNGSKKWIDDKAQLLKEAASNTLQFTF
jgi:transposase